MKQHSDYVDPTNIAAVNERVRAWARPDETIKPVAIDQVTVTEDGVGALADLVDSWAADRPVLLVGDRTAMTRTGRDVKAQVADALSQYVTLETRWLPDDPQARFHPKVEVSRSLADDIRRFSVVVSIGSGSVTDAVKYARHLVATEGGKTDRTKGPRFISFPTAASVTAYTSALAVLTVDGVKRTLASIGPDAVVCDLPTLRDAPRAMTLAGFGDVMARSVAYGDWVLANALGMDEGFSEVPGRLLDHAEDAMIAAAESVGASETTGVRTVMDALLLAGMAMSIVNQTAPVSGWEHVLSHFLDLTAAHDGREPALHGAQVGVGTLISGRAYAAMRGELDPAALLNDIDPDAYRQKVREAFGAYDPSGAMLAELWRDLEKKLTRWNSAHNERARFVEQWRAGEIDAMLAERVRPAGDIEKALNRAGCVRRFADLAPPVSDPTALAAVRFAHLVRSRLTLGDLLDQGEWMTEARARKLLEG